MLNSSHNLSETSDQELGEEEGKQERLHRADQGRESKHIAANSTCVHGTQFSLSGNC